MRELRALLLLLSRADEVVDIALMFFPQGFLGRVILLSLSRADVRVTVSIAASNRQLCSIPFPGKCAECVKSSILGALYIVVYAHFETYTRSAVGKDRHGYQLIQLSRHACSYYFEQPRSVYRNLQRLSRSVSELSRALRKQFAPMRLRIPVLSLGAHLGNRSDLSRSSLAPEFI